MILTTVVRSKDLVLGARLSPELLGESERRKFFRLRLGDFCSCFGPAALFWHEAPAMSPRRKFQVRSLADKETVSQFLLSIELSQNDPEFVAQILKDFSDLGIKPLDNVTVQLGPWEKLDNGYEVRQLQVVTVP